jgi:hypothetical protein
MIMRATPTPRPIPMPSPSEELLLDGNGVGFALEVEIVAALLVKVDVDIAVKLAELEDAVGLNWPRVACNAKRSLRAQQSFGVIGPQHQVPSIPHRTMTTVPFDKFPFCHISARTSSIPKMHRLTVHTDFKQNGLCQV